MRSSRSGVCGKRKSLPLRRMLIYTLRGRNELIPRHHGSEIAPPGPDDLNDMNREKAYESDHEPEMFPTSLLIATQDTGQPAQLHRFINRKSCNQAACSHENHRRVCDLLRGVIFALRRPLLPEVQI